MLIVHKHPDTELPEHYANAKVYAVCNDEKVEPNVLRVVDPSTYFFWQDGVDYTFAQMPDGTVVHVPWADCAPLEPEPSSV
jgi:hypothetical protein